ncbi:WD40-repeat-containing domain protein [Gymnopilus junonius]|uniref:WD40-repeat-containing domain protein n=1 Tax=Gymnopilus junonius TaxID=109634 RepID=A0A9P5NY24_GYMJU|nr:WD40-repeat-containing domain protein [Gymnopilus junonius]
MSVYPHSSVFIGPTKTIDIAGPHVQVLDNLTGNVVSTTSNEHHERHEAMKKSGPIRCAAVDREFKHLLTSGDDKMLKLWEIEGLKLLSERELPKKPTSVAFTVDSQTLLVYPFTYVPLTVKQQKDALSSHENPSGGQLILGHASPINAFLLTPDEKYIITADRDEHIRVSWFPKGYNIEMYCLGHLKFVSAIHIPRGDKSSLISGGGDPMLKIWDWMKGTIKHELPVLEVVEPFIAVRAVKRRRGWPEEDGEEAPEGKRLKRKRGRGKKGEKEQKKTGDEEEEELGGEGEVAEENTPEHVGAPENGEEAQPEKVLVIHRMESIESSTGSHIIFSAVGTTALFAFPYKLDVTASEIRHFDFKRPVVNFSLVDDRTVVVNLDGGWVPTDKSTSILLWDFCNLLTFRDSLNHGSLPNEFLAHYLTATPEEIKKLDLYGDLTAMPKYSSDADGAPSDHPKLLPIGAPELSASETVKSTKGKGKVELSKKELGRIKGKQAVLAKAQEKVSKAGEGSEEPEAKRARSESTGEGGEPSQQAEGEDITMSGA